MKLMETNFYFNQDLPEFFKNIFYQKMDNRVNQEPLPSTFYLVGSLLRFRLFTNKTANILVPEKPAATKSDHYKSHNVQ